MPDILEKSILEKTNKMHLNVKMLQCVEESNIHIHIFKMHLHHWSNGSF